MVIDGCFQEYDIGTLMMDPYWGDGINFEWTIGFE
jgi:hypothetical protein